MKYDISKNSLMKMLEELLTENKKGKYFNPLDEFHPAWSGLVNLILKSGYMNLNSKFENKSWPNFKSLIKYKEYNDFIKSHNIEISKKWNNVSLIKLWTPFEEQNFWSLSESLNNFLDKKYIKINWEKVELKIKRKLLESEKIEMDRNTNLILNNIFMLFGEINANSEFHGITSKSLLANHSLITGFILQNDDGSWDVVHSDIGNTIIRNIREKAPLSVEGLSDKEVMKWATITGNSSKPKNKYSISGGGITVLKRILLEDNSSLYCLSGNYSIDFSLKDNHESKGVDDSINIWVKKNNFHFPGTLWMFHINKPENIKKGMEEELKKLKQNYDKLRKDYLKEVKKILKGYIIK